LTTTRGLKRPDLSASSRIGIQPAICVSIGNAVDARPYCRIRLTISDSRLRAGWRSLEELGASRPAKALPMKSAGRRRGALAIALRHPRPPPSRGPTDSQLLVLLEMIHAGISDGLESVLMGLDGEDAHQAQGAGRTTCATIGQRSTGGTSSGTFTSRCTRWARAEVEMTSRSSSGLRMPRRAVATTAVAPSNERD
jgi:hypothetical protein